MREAERKVATGVSARRPLSRREIWLRFLLYPGHTLPTALAPVAVAVGLAIRDGVFAPVPVVLAFVGSWLIHVAGVFTDNYWLLRGHPDVEEHPELLEAVRSGTLRLPWLRSIIVMTFLAGVACGVPLMLRGGWPVLVLGAVGIVGAWGYAGRPLAYAARGLADVVFLGMFGVVAPLGIWYIQAAWVVESGRAWWSAAAVPPALVWLVGLSAGALVTSVLVIDDIRDRHFDARKDWRTPAVRWGLGFSRGKFMTLALFGQLWPLALWLGFGLDPWVLLPLALLPEVVVVARAVRNQDTTEALLPYTPRASRLAMLHGILLGLGLALSG